MKVTGILDGKTSIDFTKNNETGLWEALVPFSQSGEYIVQIYATDDAGNQTYWGRVLVTVDTEKMTMTIKALMLTSSGRKELCSKANIVSIHSVAIKEYVSKASLVRYDSTINENELMEEA